MKVLHMLEEDQSCTATALHFGVSIETITRIKKLEGRVRMTTDITFNMSAKLINSFNNRPPIFMEAALVAWIVNRLYKNVALHKKTVTAKVLSLYHTFTDKAINDNRGGGENGIRNLQPDILACTQYKKRFCAGRMWLKAFLER